MDLSEIEIDTLREVINIGIGKAAALLNTLVGKHVTLEVPQLFYMSGDELLKSGKMVAAPDETVSGVKLSFKGGINGSAAVIFPIKSSQNLVNITIQDVTGDYDTLKAGAMTEIGNILINGVVGSISNILKQNIRYHIPQYWECHLRELVGDMSRDIHDLTYFLVAEIMFTVQSNEIVGNFILFFELDAFEKLLRNYIAEPLV